MGEKTVRSLIQKSMDSVWWIWDKKHTRSLLKTETDDTLNQEAEELAQQPWMMDMSFLWTY